MCGVGFIRYICGHRRLFWQNCGLAEDSPFYIRHACPNYKTHTKILKDLCGPGPTLAAQYCAHTPGGKLLDEAFKFLERDGPGFIRLRRLNAKVERLVKAIQALFVRTRNKGLSHLEADDVVGFNKLKASFEKAYGKRNLLVADKCRYEKLIRIAEDHYKKHYNQNSGGPIDASTIMPDFPLHLQQPHVPDSLAHELARQREHAMLRLLDPELAVNTGLLDATAFANMAYNRFHDGIQPAQPVYPPHNMQQIAVPHPYIYTMSGLAPPLLFQQSPYPPTQQQQYNEEPLQQERLPKRKRNYADRRAANDHEDPAATARRNEFMKTFQSVQQQSKDKVAGSMVKGGYSVDQLRWYNPEQAQLEKLQGVQDPLSRPKVGRPKSRGGKTTSRVAAAPASDANDLRRSTRARTSNIKYKESPSSVWSSDDPSPVKSAKSDAAWRDDEAELSEGFGSPMKRRKATAPDPGRAPGANAPSFLSDKILTHKRLTKQAPSFPPPASLESPFEPNMSGRSSGRSTTGLDDANNPARIPAHNPAYDPYVLAAVASTGPLHPGLANTPTGPPQWPFSRNDLSGPAPPSQTTASRMGFTPVPNVYSHYAWVPPSTRYIATHSGTDAGSSLYQDDPANRSNVVTPAQLGSQAMPPIVPREDPNSIGHNQMDSQRMPMGPSNSFDMPQQVPYPDMHSHSLPMDENRTPSPPNGSAKLLTRAYQPPSNDHFGNGLENSGQQNDPYEHFQPTVSGQADTPLYPNCIRTAMPTGTLHGSNRDFVVSGQHHPPTLAAPFPSLNDQSVVHPSGHTNSLYPDYEGMQRSFSAPTQLTPRSSAADTANAGFDTDPKKRALPTKPSPAKRLSFPGQDEVPVLSTEHADFDFGMNFGDYQMAPSQDAHDSAHPRQDEAPAGGPAVSFHSQSPSALKASTLTDHEAAQLAEMLQQPAAPHAASSSRHGSKLTLAINSGDLDDITPGAASGLDAAFADEGINWNGFPWE